MPSTHCRVRPFAWLVPSHHERQTQGSGSRPVVRRWADDDRLPAVVGSHRLASRPTRDPDGRQRLARQHHAPSTGRVASGAHSRTVGQSRFRRWVQSRHHGAAEERIRARFRGPREQRRDGRPGLAASHARRHPRHDRCGRGVGQDGVRPSLHRRGVRDRRAERSRPRRTTGCVHPGRTHRW